MLVLSPSINCIDLRTTAPYLAMPCGLPVLSWLKPALAEHADAQR